MVSERAYLTIPALLSIRAVESPERPALVLSGAELAALAASAGEGGPTGHDEPAPGLFARLPEEEVPR
jgi:hypothetical protein